MDTTLSFAFPRETAGNAILCLPSELYKVRITGKIDTPRTMTGLVGALQQADIKIHLDLSELEGLQCIGRWGTLEQARNECLHCGYEPESTLGEAALGKYTGFCKTESLASIILPPSIQFIGNASFAGCSSLKEIVLECVEPPEGYAYSFPEDATLYVPAESVEKYENWCESRLNIQSIQSKES